MTEKERGAAIRHALKNNQVFSIEFSSDGSCVGFHYIHPTADHGLPCSMYSSIKTEEAIHLLRGFRFKQHDRPMCF